MSDGITLHCPRCGKYSALKKEYDEYKEIDVYTCQDKDCKRMFAIEQLIRKIPEQLQKEINSHPDIEPKGNIKPSGSDTKEIGGLVPKGNNKVGTKEIGGTEE